MRKPVALVLALAAAPALGQEAAPQLEEDPRAAKYHDVERGFFAGTESGFLMLFSTPTADKNRFPFAGDNGGLASGFMAGAHAGYDINEKFALALFALGGNPKASVNYGAFDVVAVGADARFAFYSSMDGNDIERLYLYVHGRAGYLFTHPCGLFAGSYNTDSNTCSGNGDVLVGAGPGIEYFTRLRHFSIGIAADFQYAVKAGAPGLAILPTLRYTFQ